jgi:CMP-N-acetylneuraminic acid synthetase
MAIKALVAVRSGSQRVLNKNIRPFAGSSLLEIKLKQLSHITKLDGIIVNSNDDDMLNLAKKYNCETVKRDEYYASNAVSMSDVYQNMAENCNTDIIVYANCTNPLLYDETLAEAIDFFWSINKEYDSVNSAHLIKEFLFKDNKPINYDLKHQPRSQDLPNIYALNFAFNILARDKMIACKNVVGDVPYVYGIDEVEATDIDNDIDFEFAEFLYRERIRQGQE